MTLTEVLANIFWFFLGELVVIVIAYFLRDDKRKMVAVFTAGTVFAGAAVYVAPRMVSRWTTPDRFVTVSLAGPSSVRSPEVIELPAGRHVINGVPFDTDWTAKTPCANETFRPSAVTIGGLDIDAVRSVYLLIMAGNGTTAHYQEQLGQVVLNFSGSGHESRTALVLGQNIRDWSVDHSGAVTTYTSAALREAYRADSWEPGSEGRVDMLTIDDVDQYAGLGLVEIRIEDTNSSAPDPCIYVLGVTAEVQR